MSKDALGHTLNGQFSPTLLLPVVRRVLAAFAALLATAAYADLAPAVIGLHALSAHTSNGHQHTVDGRNWNNVNPGLYARWANGLTIGGYRNSIRRQSVYAGWTWQTDDERLALTAGVVTGYAHVTRAEGPWVSCPFHTLGARASMNGTQCQSWRYGYESRVLPLLAPSVRFAMTDKSALRLSLLGPRRPVLHLSLEWTVE